MPIQSHETAERWNRSLRGFRFNRAAGGPTLDMDNIYGRVRFVAGGDGLNELFRRLELPLCHMPNKEEVSSSMADQPCSLPTAAWDYSSFAQPGFTRLFGAPVHIEIYCDWISIQVTGALGFSWEVFEEDFSNAMMLEELFRLRGIHFIVE